MNLKVHYYQEQRLRMKYVEAGTGRPLLFLHGAGFNALTYRKILLSLAEKYHVIAPDLPCFGDSTVPETIWNFADYASLFDRFTSFLKLKNLCVIGHSFGGGVGLYFAAQTDKVAKIILVNSMGIVPKTSMKKLCLLAVKKTIIDFLFDDKKIALFIFYDAITNFIFKHFFKLVKSYNIVKRSTFQSPILTKDIKIPALILQGTKDEIISEEAAQLLQKLIKNSTLEFINDNHDWPLFKQTLFINKVENFFKK